jgi:hypothetical protein
MLPSVSPPLFDIGNASATRNLLLLLTSVPSLPVAFVATICHVIANPVLPDIMSLECRFFGKQYQNWEHLDMTELCQFLIGAFDSFEAKAQQKSCVLYHGITHLPGEYARFFEDLRVR